MLALVDRKSVKENQQTNIPSKRSLMSNFKTCTLLSTGRRRPCTMVVRFVVCPCCWPLLFAITREGAAAAIWSTSGERFVCLSESFITRLGAVLRIAINRRAGLDWPGRIWIVWIVSITFTTEIWKSTLKRMLWPLFWRMSIDLEHQIQLKEQNRIDHAQSTLSDINSCRLSVYRVQSLS